MNDGIEPVVCSLQYTSVDEAVRVLSHLGPQAMKAKFDIESAYRIVPVHQQTDRSWVCHGMVSFMWIQLYLLA